MPGSRIEFHREQLYEEVWTTPISRLAPKYGLSDVGLRKICDRLSVPAPPRGYWTRLRHGYDVPRTPLRRLKKGIPETYTRTSISHGPKEDGAEKTTANPDKLTRKIPREILVPSRLYNPHHLVVQTREALRKGVKDPYDRFHTRGGGHLDVSVHASSMDRALRILNTLVKEAERSGFSVGTRAGRYAESYLVMEGEQLQFGLSERLRREKHKPKGLTRPWSDPTWDYFPTGVLRLGFKKCYTCEGRKRWSDTRNQRLEEVIGVFLSRAFDLIQVLKEERRQVREAHRRREEEARRQREVEELRKAEERRRRALEHQAGQWAQSRTLAAYIAEVERQVSGLKLTAEQRQESEAWLTWARTHADRLNPLRAGLPFLKGKH